MQVAEKNDRLNLPTFGVSVLNLPRVARADPDLRTTRGDRVRDLHAERRGEPEQFVGARISPR